MTRRVIYPSVTAPPDAGLVEEQNWNTMAPPLIRAVAVATALLIPSTVAPLQAGEGSTGSFAWNVQHFNPVVQVEKVSTLGGVSAPLKVPDVLMGWLVETGQPLFSRRPLVGEGAFSWKVTPQDTLVDLSWLVQHFNPVVPIPFAGLSQIVSPFLTGTGAGIPPLSWQVQHFNPVVPIPFAGLSRIVAPLQTGEGGILSFWNVQHFNPVVPIPFADQTVIPFVIPPDIAWKNITKIFRFGSEEHLNVFYRLRVTVKAVTGSIYIRLYNLSNSVEVEGSEISTSSTTPIWIQSGEISLINKRQYVVQLGISPGSDGTVYGADLFASRV